MAAKIRTAAEIPELDRAGWSGIHEAHSKILKGQAVFLDRLLETLSSC
jgi:predicted NUDIX family NTP pyrophosphohydrolase